MPRAAGDFNTKEPRHPNSNVLRQHTHLTTPRPRQAVEGRVKASSIQKVGDIVDKDPDGALNIVRDWMYQEN